MAIDTVVQFADDQHTKATDALTAARTTFADATKAAQDAAADVADIAKRLADEQKKGRELQAAPRPSAAATRALADEQAKNEVAVNALTARLAAAQEAAAGADARLAEAQADATRAQARVEDRKRFRDSAVAAAKDWKVIEQAVQAVVDRPQSIPDTVDAIKASKSYRDAETRVNNEVPLKLRTDGRARADIVRARAKKAGDDEQDAIKAVAAKNKLHRGKSGDVAPARLLFAVSQALVREIAGVPGELDQIKAKLDAINSAPPLIQGAVDSIADLADAGKKAITDLPGLKTKFEEARTKVEEQEEKIHDKEADIAAPPAGADLVQLQADLTSLKKKLDEDLTPELEKAEKAYRASAMDLDLWEAAVPDAAWQRLLAFDEIARRLTELKAKFTTQKITALRDDLKAAEKELVKALDAEATANREIEAAELAAQRQRDLAQAARELYDTNQLAAIRGDA